MEDDHALTRISAEPTETKELAPTAIAGDRVGRYRLAFEVASGGMATVYLAVARGPGGFDKVVALKRIHAHLAKEKNYVEMFLDEARLAARIQHPNVCSVIDFGEERGEYFLTMEYMLGVPLSRFLSAVAKMKQERPKRWPAIASRLVQDACEGLHAAHELRASDGTPLGVVHRDVSPQNLFVGFDGTLKVVDFGIAKAADKVSVTRTLELKGKVPYMAPEQIRKGQVDRRTDVFALGVVLWESLTLRRLFKRSQQVDTMYSVLEARIPSPSEVNDNVPEDLDEAVLGALARDASVRTPDARAFGRAVGRVWGRELTEPVDRAEIAQLMGQLFPGKEAEQRDLMEAARTETEPSVRPPAPAQEVQSFQEDGTTLEVPEQISIDSGRGKQVAAALVFLAVLGSVGAYAAFGRGGGDSPGEEVTLAHSDPVNDLGDVVDAVDVVDDADGVADASSVPGDASVTGDASATDDAAIEGGGPAAIVGAGAGTDMRRRRRRRVPAADPPAMEPEVAMEAVVTMEEVAVAPTEPGNLIVVVPGGWANIYDARGRLLGATPLRRRMAPGEHVLELRFNGQPPPVRFTVQIASGETARITRRPP